MKKLSIFLLTSLIEKGMAFLLIPLYTHYLTTTDYGILTISQSMIAILSIFFTLSLNGAATRYHFDGNDFYRRYHYGNIFFSVSLISIVVSVVFFICSGYIFKLLGDIPTYPYVYYILFLAYATSIFSIYQVKLQMQSRALEYGVNNIVKFLIASLVSIYFVVVLKEKADGVLFGMSTSLALFVFYIFYKLKKEKIKFNLHKKILKKNVKYSINLVPHSIASVLMQFLDKFFISSLLNVSQAGVYALGGQISAVLGIVSSAINNATVPQVLKAYKDKNYRYLKDLANMSIFFLTIMALFFSIFSKEIISFVSPESYANASIVISTLTFYFVVQMYYFMTSSVLFYVESATKYVAVATTLSLLLNASFNYFLIPVYGILGASIATLISMVLVNYIVVFIANRYIIIGFEHLKIHFVIIVAFILANLDKIMSLSMKVIVFILFLLMLYWIEKDNSLLQNFKKRFYEKIYR